LDRDKIRVYILARELNIESKDLVDMCRQAGIDVKNQLSSLDPEQRDQIVLLVRKGPSAAAKPAPQKTVAPVIPTVMTPVPNLSARAVRREPEAKKPAEPVPEHTPAKPQPHAPAAKLPETPAAPPAEPSQPPEPVSKRPADIHSKPPDLSPKPVVVGKVPDLGQSRPDAAPRPQRKREIPRPGMPRVATPPPLKPRPITRELRPTEPVAQKPIARPPQALRGGPLTPGAVEREMEAGQAPPTDIDEDDGDAKGSRGAGRPGGVAGRDKRHQQRNERARLRRDRGDTERSGGRLLVTLEDDRPQRVKQRLRQARQKERQITQPRKGKVPISLPITVRSLSEAVGIRSGELLFKLKDALAGEAVTINSTIDPEIASALGLEAGIELEIKRPVDTEESLLAEVDVPDEPDQLEPRAPVVAVMGHVDHGKTSLLDRIRQSDIAATEAGGITQVIRAWRVEHGGHPITFLDTPGHEAFTKMRARGAQVTDIAVIVVAADDGVMPQTEEAINHARAAGVPIVVSINKVDLPNANVNKTRQQLYGLQVLPDNMGGDTPFVETSASTGKGINELLDSLSIVAETLLEIKANPNKPGRGTCLEAMLSEGEGVLATLLVRNGTLRRGDVIVCGPAYGRARAMYDDLGRPIQEAGPSVPVRITGLSEVPDADDSFHVVKDLGQAREIASKRQARRLESAIVKREPARLESLTELKIAELKIILKADFRGSIEAIRKELEKFHHDEVRVRILHAAIGGITESDVQLALTSPKDSIIVGFNVVPDDRARALAEEKNVQIRQYSIIYQLTDDIRAALEGRLKPREEVIHLGRAVVRETFKISRVGTIAGCYVTQGVIERSAKIRVIREGVVIYPPSERSASLESLKRFKEDVREVREGFECGMKIAGYDDIKVGDVIEAFKVEQIQRTL
jgi:translation initiation factor IF-2